MGNYPNKQFNTYETNEKENIIRYDITLHKLVHNDEIILNSEKNMEKHVDYDIALISNITNCDNNIIKLVSQYNKNLYA